MNLRLKTNSMYSSFSMILIRETVLLRGCLLMTSHNIKDGEGQLCDDNFTKLSVMGLPYDREKLEG